MSKQAQSTKVITTILTFAAFANAASRVSASVFYDSTVVRGAVTSLVHQNSGDTYGPTIQYTDWTPLSGNPWGPSAIASQYATAGSVAGVALETSPLGFSITSFATSNTVSTNSAWEASTGASPDTAINFHLNTGYSLYFTYSLQTTPGGSDESEFTVGGSDFGQAFSKDNYNPTTPVTLSGMSAVHLPALSQYNGNPVQYYIFLRASSGNFSQLSSMDSSSVSVVQGFLVPDGAAAPKSGQTVIGSGTASGTVLQGQHGEVDGIFKSTSGGNFYAYYNEAAANIVAQQTGAFSFAIPGTSGNAQAWWLEFDNASNLSSNAEILLHFDSSGFSSQEESQLAIFHFVNGGWQELPTTVDTLNNTVSFETNSFSPFVLGLSNVAIPEPTTLSMIAVSALILLRRQGVKKEALRFFPQS